MKRVSVVYAILFVWLAMASEGLWNLVSGDTTTVFYVVAVSGQAQLARSDGEATPVPLTNGMGLSPDDSIIVGGNAHVVVIANDGSLGVLRTNCRGKLAHCLVMRENENRRRSPLSGIWKALQAVVGRVETQRMVSASVRGLEPSNTAALVILSPRNSAVLGTQPILHWKPVPDAMSYVVTVSRGYEPVWETSVGHCTECKTEVPEGVLVPGQKYFWTVRANLEDSILEQTTAFWVLSPDSAAMLSEALESIDTLQTETDTWIYSQLRALVYASFQLYGDAVQSVQGVAVGNEADRRRKRELLLGLLRSMDVSANEIAAFGIE